jgi:hypothetical protein
MPMKKKKFHLFWNGKERLKVWDFFFSMFSNRKEGNKYVQNILLALFFSDKSS